MTDVEKKTLKITWIKAGSVLFGSLSICLTIGICFGNWQEWRSNINDRLNKIEVVVFPRADYKQAIK